MWCLTRQRHWNYPEWNLMQPSEWNLTQYSAWKLQWQARMYMGSSAGF